MSEPFPFGNPARSALTRAFFPLPTHGHIKVGGWSEFQDLGVRHYSEDKSIEESNKVVEFMKLHKTGCTTFPGPRLKGRLEDASFKNVREEVFKAPFTMSGLFAKSRWRALA